jgi:hypothetical protein
MDSIADRLPHITRMAKGTEFHQSGGELWQNECKSSQGKRNINSPSWMTTGRRI